MAIQYSFTTVSGFLPADASAAGFNDQGQIVGTYADAGDVHGFVYQNGKFETVDATGLAWTILTDINNLGQISGYTSNLGGALAFVLDNGSQTDVPFQGGATRAFGINESGQVTVFGGLGCGCNGEAAVGFPPYTDNPGDYQLVSYPEADRTDASKLNNFGLVVGTYTNSDFSTHGFIYDIASDSYATLDPPYANLFHDLQSINDAGTIVGNYTNDDFLTRGFVTDGSTFARFDHPLGADGTFLYDINSIGQILGAYLVGSNVVNFVATPTHLTQSQFNALITPMTGADVAADVIDYLHAQNVYVTAGSTAKVETVNDPPVAVNTRIAVLAADSATITTGGALRFVINSVEDSELVVKGAAKVGIASGHGDNKISLQGTGNNTVFLGDGMNTVWAGLGRDTVHGGSGDSLLIANEDLTLGQKGSSFFGGDGNETFFDGGAGSNRFEGGGGNDTMFGGAGRDTMIAGGGDDFLQGGSGNEVMVGGNGHDQLFGGDGRDTMTSGDTLNYLDGEGGNDHLFGIGSDNTLKGGDGKDYLEASGTGHQLSGGVGNDTLVAGGGSVLHGDGGKDKLTATTGSNSLFGDTGNDTLWAGTGNDTLSGGGGNDLLITNPNGTAETQTAMFGGGGDDSFEITSHDGDSAINGGTGTDVVFFDDRTFGSADIQTSGGTTTVTFSDTGQEVTVTSVETLVFSDQFVNL